jgi:transcriptional regulator with XRE-family HTH domain
MNVEKLKNARLAAAMSQDDVAEKVGISQVAYSFFERGLKSPSLPVAARIARTLNVSLDELVGDEK